jgi:hypothetical protein
MGHVGREICMRVVTSAGSTALVQISMIVAAMVD